MKPTFVQKLAVGCCLAVAAAIVRPAAAQADPDFDAVSWTAIACDNPDLIEETSPAGVSFAGNVASSPAFYAFDADHLYFRYRMDDDPSGAHGFAQYSWTALMQVPTGNAFQYQYQLSLNGKDDTIEVWKNTIASDIDFSPLFQDDAEIQLHTQSFSGLARKVAAGTSFGGDADYFVDFAFPVSVLVNEGVIGSAAELADSFFFPATSTNPNNYNKGRLNCTFLPGTTLEIAKEAVPATSLPAYTTTEAGFVVTVTNVGPLAKGITIDDPALPSYLGNVDVSTSSSDPNAGVTVVSTNPIRVRAQRLAAGESITVEITGDASPTCADEDFTNVATAFAVNAPDVDAEAVMDVRKGGGGEEGLCDGLDNDCDGTVDENTDASCDDGDPCNGSETCGGVKGCEAGLPLNCGDGNACTVDSCVDGVGCAHQAVPGCAPCDTPSDCSDGNACTTESCNGGICGSDPIPGCTPCDDAGDCSDGNACTTESCNAGVCGNTAIPGCTPCDTPSDCSDGNACTTESCDAGVCGNTAIPGCTPCDTPSDCNDGNACTTESCDAGVCGSTTILGCTPCDTPSDCNDGNACTTESCDAGVCGSTTMPGCTPCDTPSDCNDGNACTTESCDAGVCGNTAIPGCTPCDTPSDCNDGNACTTESCDAGVCGSTTILGCTPCDTPSDCNDGNACTIESCDAGVCGNTAIPGCVPCDEESDCADTSACTTDACVDGACSNQAVPGCVPCTTADECGDGSGCTTDTCDAGACAHQTIPGCVSCATVTDCADGNPCTDETCSADGVCGHTNREGCVPCTTIADCDDQNACSTDVCQADGSCGHVVIPGCKTCQQVSDCADDDECTTEACTAGRCEYTEAEQCAEECTSEPEVCGDGNDNDCDGSTDCDDENCSAAPGCEQPVEVCGDCVDNDFDGLVDYEDSDCCAEQMALGLKKVTLRTKAPRSRGNGLRMKARNLRGNRAVFNPLREDTTLQIKDESGQLFCTTVASKYWKKKGKSFRFRDKKGTFAGGLKKGRFKVKKNGQIVFRTSGRKMTLRAPSKRHIDMTLRVGESCWLAPATLRQRKSRLVAP